MIPSLVIVGHGPSLKGAGLGKEIDACSFVVRLKNCSMLLAEPHDFGTRRDALCTSTETLYNLPKLKATEYWGYPKHGEYSESRVRQAERQLDAKIQIPLEAVNLWNAAFLELGGQHPNVSTGMGALIIALELKRPETVYLAGFDNVLDPSIEGYRCTVPSPYNAGGTQGTGHDWVTEKKLLGYLQPAYNVKIKSLARRHIVLA
jgi:hypothetical protein